MSDTPIYDQIRAEKLLDPADPADPAAERQVPDDAQSRAYREMRPEDAVADDDIHLHAERTHAPLVDPRAIPGPDQYERFGWDDGREDPR